MTYFQPLAVFMLAGLCGIGGGCLLWQWLKTNRPGRTGLLGTLLLVACDWVGT